MKLVHKIIGSSILFVGIILVTTISSDILDRKVEDSVETIHKRTNDAEKVVFKAKLYLRDEVSQLKDYLVLGKSPEKMEAYHQSVINFFLALKELDTLMFDSSTLVVVRQNHRSFTNLVTDIKTISLTLSESQQYYQKILHHQRKIDASLNLVIDTIEEQEDVSEEKVEDVKEITKIITAVSTLIILIIFCCYLIFVLLPVTRSIKSLHTGAIKIGSGHWDYRLNIKTKDEIEQLACEFNNMAEKLVEFYRSLEMQILERTQELTQTNQQLEQEILERQQIAHELQETLENLQKTQTKLIQTEKMSSLGQMVAGVAHEINNPINFIYGNITHAGEYMQEMMSLIQLYQKYYPQPASEILEHQNSIEFEFLQEDLLKILSSMKIGAERIREIILSLRNFSRLDESEMKEVNLHEGIESTLLILQHRLKLKPDCPGIKVIKNYGKIPLIECYPGQLNQVLMNILTNAIDAIESQDQSHSSQASYPNQLGCITIQTQQLNTDWVEIKISDTGPGIAPDIMQRLFDPFFTTKDVGKGTGLGLSISYQIVVEKHKGHLKCSSKIGEGTEFIIEIPIRQNRTVVHQLTPANPSLASIPHEEIAFNTSKPAP